MEIVDYEFAGLPLHVLLVHVVIVMAPAVGFALIVIAVWPAARRVLWLPVLLGAGALLPLGLVTVEAGKWLEQRVPPAPLIQTHTAQGEDIVPWLVWLLVVAVVIAAWAVAELIARRRTTDDERRGIGRGAVVAASAVLTIGALVVAIGSTWTIVRIGESGSRAVWEGSFSDEPLER